MSNLVRRAYDTLKHVPGGMTVFSKIVGRAAPYTGTLGARVLEIGEGYARVELRDRKGVRNHLKSIHAVALVNLAEMTSGVGMIYGFPADARGILTGLSIEYIKKARGTLTAECRCPVPESSERSKYDVEIEIRNSDNVVVARATAHWLVGPKSR